MTFRPSGLLGRNTADQCCMIDNWSSLGIFTGAEFGYYLLVKKIFFNGVYTLERCLCYQEECNLHVEVGSHSPTSVYCKQYSPLSTANTIHQSDRQYLTPLFLTIQRHRVRPVSSASSASLPFIIYPSLPMPTQRTLPLRTHLRHTSSPSISH